MRRPMDLVFTSNGKSMFGSQDGFASRWDGETGARAWWRDAGVGTIFGLAELADGRLILGGEASSVRMLDGVTGREIMACEGHTDWVNAVIFLGEISVGAFATGSTDKTIQVWANDGSQERVVAVGEWVLALALSPCGNFAVSSGGGGHVRLYRLPGWESEWSVVAHVKPVCSIAWSPNGRFIASGSYDETVKIISTETGAVLRSFSGRNHAIASVIFSQDSTKVLAISSKKAVRVWRIFWATERRVRALMSGMEVGVEDWEMREVCLEIVEAMKRLWRVEE
jgi:WD40 repeat protein